MTAVAEGATAPEGIVLAWEQLYLNLDVVDTYPTDRFADLLKAVISSGDTVRVLDFSGIQQLTDDVFYALKKVVAKTKLRDTIRHVDCTGCVHITDFGVGYLAQSLPSLEQITLSGCRQLTGASLSQLQRYCTQLSSIDVSGTSVTWMPSIQQSVAMSMNGCPLLLADASSTKEGLSQEPSSYSFQHKLIIMLYTGCRFDVLDFLSQSSDHSAASGRPKTTDGRRRLEYRCNVNFEGIDEDFNVTMCYGNYSLVSLSFTSECIFIIVIDIAMDNPQLHIVNRLSAIRSSVSYSGVIILGLVDNKTEDDSSSQLITLGNTLEGYMKQQTAVLDSHLQHDAFDSDEARCRDFDTQQRFCRSLRASQNICQLYLFSVNRESSNVCLKWPEINTNEEKPSEEIDDESEINPVVAARTKWLSDLEGANARVSRLNKLDLTELRSMERLPELAQQTLDAMCYILTFGKKKKVPTATLR